jgi:hypothetical protein
MRSRVIGIQESRIKTQCNVGGSRFAAGRATEIKCEGACGVRGHVATDGQWSIITGSCILSHAGRCFGL